MSRASDWAIAMGISDTNNEDQAALKPPGFIILDDVGGVNFSAFITRDGGLNIERGALMSSDQAIQLGQWLEATFSG
jgi:hypothetical protein